MKTFRIALGVLLALACAVTYARHHHAKPSSGEPGQFDYYLLTLSWSPTYCLTHPQDHTQCSGKGYGFVLHGLWPQFDAGNWPQFCSTEPLPSGNPLPSGVTVISSRRISSGASGRPRLGCADLF